MALKVIRGGDITRMGVGFQTKFKGALANATSLYPKIATPVTSTTRLEEYGWLSDLPSIREWIGDRKIREASANVYRVPNKDWEGTLGVDRNDVMDDNLGLYGTKIDMLAEAAGRHKDELLFQMLGDGFASDCYDGQYFFDTDHPVIDKDGGETSFSNFGGGAGAAWFLLVTGGALKPLIIQERTDYQFVSQDSPNSEGVFWQKKFFYGCDARYNGAYTLPQLAWGDKNTLDDAHFEAAYDGLLAMPKDGGGKVAPIGFTLVVGPSNRAAGEKVVGAEFLAGGASNVNYKKADLIVAPWLE